MSFAEDIGRYIQQEYENPYALPVSLNFTPDDTTNSISVYDTGGFASLRMYGACPPIGRPTAQVLIRHSSISTAREVAESLYCLLDGIYNQTINETPYLRVECNAPPTYIGATQVSTQGQAHEFSLNMNSDSQKNALLRETDSGQTHVHRRD